MTRSETLAIIAEALAKKIELRALDVLIDGELHEITITRVNITSNQ